MYHSVYLDDLSYGIIIIVTQCCLRLSYEFNFKHLVYCDLFECVSEVVYSLVGQIVIMMAAVRSCAMDQCMSMESGGSGQTKN
jgi:hypothetical protein